MDAENDHTERRQLLSLVHAIREIPNENTREQIGGLVRNLINDDFNGLIQLLYRIDIDEKKLKDLLQQNQGIESALLITDMIIERELQKSIIREKFSDRQRPSSEDSW